MRAMPVDRRRSAPPAARHPITHAPQRTGAFRATSLRMAFHAAQRLLHAVRGDGQQHWPCLQGLRQHRHRGMRHAGAYARVGETCQLLAVQPPHPRHLIPASGWQRRDGCARAAHGSHGRVVLAFPLAQRATGVRQRHKHSPCDSARRRMTPRACAYGIIPSACWYAASSTIMNRAGPRPEHTWRRAVR